MEKFSLLKYTIEKEFLSRLSKCKWWEFGKKRSARQWRENKLKKINQ